MKKWFVISIIFLMSGICSCRTTVKYVPVKTVRTDSVYFNTHRIDSVFIHDSVSMIQRGDTITEYRYRYIYKYKDKIDTLYINRTDSINVPYPVERELSRWERTKIEIGGWAIGLLSGAALLGIGYVIVWLVRRR